MFKVAWLMVYGILQMGRVDAFNQQNSRKDVAFSWTNVYEKEPTPSTALGES